MMKVYNAFAAVFALFTLFASDVAVMAQPCGTTQNCNPNLKYPYRFCKGLKLEYKCTNNPNNEPGLTPYRALIMPTCAKLVPGPGDPTSSIMEDVDGNRFDVNKQTDWADVINQAVDSWNCLCGQTNSNSSLNSCCIKVYWSNNPADFDDPLEVLGSYRSNINEVCGTACVNGELITSNRNPKIILNNTSDFTLLDPSTGLTRKSLYSGTTVPKGPSNKQLKGGYTVYSLRDVFLHEFGHWLGMLHPDGNPPVYPDCEPNVRKTGIMQSSLDANRDPRGLSDQDKCQFMKLYCPATTSVQWAEIQTFPSQNEALILRVNDGLAQVIGVDCDQVVVRAFTIEGRDLGEIGVVLETSIRSMTLDMRMISTGVTVLTFTCPDRGTVTRRMFLVDHSDR